MRYSVWNGYSETIVCEDITSAMEIAEMFLLRTHKAVIHAFV